MSNRSFYSRISKDDFFDIASFCNLDINIDHAYEVSAKYIKGEKTDEVVELESRWYNSLKDKNYDYSVYNDKYYICDIWACWVLYSRKSIYSVVKSKVFKKLSGAKLVVDLGCGFGYTTAYLKEVFCKASVIGTNLKDSYQFKYASNLGSKHDFKIKSDLKDIGKRVDIIFASEYFEHFENPIEHLYSIVSNVNPKYMIIANGFNGTAIGHFKEYIHLGSYYSNSQMSKMFGKAMRMMGYVKLETGIWNNRPAIWERLK